MPKSNPICNRCGIVLDSENWYASNRKVNRRICKKCGSELNRLWREANQDKVRVNRTRYTRNQGHLPFSVNKECASYLGIHVAEKVLSRVFNDVEVMPMNHPGFDFICNRGKKIDVKSSCLQKSGGWHFKINRNTTADYFLCLAFDNREDLTPLHVWLLPGSEFNHRVSTSIRPITAHKWDAHRLDISKISDCCVALSNKE